MDILCFLEQLANSTREDALQLISVQSDDVKNIFISDNGAGILKKQITSIKLFPDAIHCVKLAS